MARISIYVPDDLKARMDAVGDAINWSNVVRPAIHSAIANLEHQKGQSMETAIERLRASKQEHARQKASDGKAEGRQWASNSAEFSVLKALAAYVDQYGLDDADAMSVLRSAFDPSGEMSPRDVYDELGFDGSATDEYALAFIEGAVEFYQEVEDQL